MALRTPTESILYRNDLLRRAQRELGMTANDAMRLPTTTLEMKLGLLLEKPQPLKPEEVPFRPDNERGRPMPPPSLPELKVEPKHPPLDPQPEPEHKSEMDAGLAPMLAEALKPYLDIKLDEAKARAMINDSLSVLQDELHRQMFLQGEQFRAYLEEAMRPRQVEYVITKADLTEVKIDRAHIQFIDILRFARIRKWIYFYGKPGAGKNHACRQAAEVLGMTYSYVSLTPDTSKVELFGYTGADGKTIKRTNFMDRYEYGGMFFCDEIDNMSAGLGTALNGALANGIASFPQGEVEMHPDFMFIAAANTMGRGGDVLHQSRRPIDAATLDRFISIEFTYDEALELALVTDRNPVSGPAWLEWVQTVRHYIDRNSLPVVASPRASYTGAQLLADPDFNDYPLDAIADMLIFNKGVPPTIRETILRNCPLPDIKRAPLPKPDSPKAKASNTRERGGKKSESAQEEGAAPTHG